MATQKQASAVRYITFVSTGSLYTAFLHASTGDVKQQYDDAGGFYPEISASDPITVQFVATSSQSSGVVVPDSIDYFIAGTQLSFDATGACTTSGASAYFRKSGKDLVIVGNIAEYLGKQSAVLSAEAKKGSDTITASAMVTVSPWTGLDHQAEVSIIDESQKAFTFRARTDTLMLSARVLVGGTWRVNIPSYTYVWYISDASKTDGWRQLKSAKGDSSLSISAKDVDTYANVKVEVYRKRMISLKNVLLGADTAGVMDASDPLDIIDTVVLNRTGSGAEEAVSSLRLDSTMPDGAYLKFTPKVVVRGTTSPLTDAVTWLAGILCDPTGLQTRTITPSSGSYKVLVSDLGAVPGVHSLIMTGQLL